MVQEWCAYWGHSIKDVPSKSLDILDLELLLNNGTIVPPEEDWRKEYIKNCKFRN